MNALPYASSYGICGIPSIEATPRGSTLKQRSRLVAHQRLRALIVTVGLVLAGVVGLAPQAQAADGNILPPFDQGRQWWVCQGYNNAAVTHTGTSSYGLDLTGGPNCDNSASGRTVRAPMGGTVHYYQASYGNLCVNVTGGRSYTLTHINSSVTSGSVTAGQSVGTVGAPGTRGNNGVAHIHFQMWDTANCYSSSGIPFDSAHGTRICGAPDLTSSGPNNGNGTWSGTSFTGQSCGSAASATSKPAVVKHGTEMDVFVRGGDGQIYKKTWNGANWVGFSSLGGSMSSDPVAVSFNGELSVFAIGTNGQVYKNTWNGSSWSGFNSLGGNMTGRPSAVKYGSSELTVFARGVDGHIYKNTWNGSSWSGFNSLGGGMASDPIGVQYNSELTVFARGTNNQIYKNTWNGSSWSGFSAMGGNMVGNPHAIQYGSEFDLFARGADGHIYKKTWNGSSWSGFNSLGGGFVGDPFGLKYNSELTVFARGTNGSIYKTTWNGSSWSGFSSLGGSLAGDPVALQFNTELSLFAIGSNGHTYKNTWNGSTWSTFHDLN